MHKPVTFDPSQIAPCGMNCGTCLAYLRIKNHCPGCRIRSAHKAESILRCSIINCTYLEMTDAKFCYACDKFPCKRMKQLDKRYKTKYSTSFMENLLMIKEKGMETFLIFESKRRTCTECGTTLCVHRNACPGCKTKVSTQYLS